MARPVVLAAFVAALRGLTKLISGEADIAYSSYTPFFVANSKNVADAGFLTEPFVTQAKRSAGAVVVADTATGTTANFPTAGYGALGSFVSSAPKTQAAFQRAMAAATRDAADRAKIEPLMVKYAKVDADTAAHTGLLTFRSAVDGSAPVDVAAMVAK